MFSMKTGQMHAQPRVRQEARRPESMRQVEKYRWGAVRADGPSLSVHPLPQDHHVIDAGMDRGSNALRAFFAEGEAKLNSLRVLYQLVLRVRPDEGVALYEARADCFGDGTGLCTGPCS